MIAYTTLHNCYMYISTQKLTLLDILLTVYHCIFEYYVLLYGKLSITLTSPSHVH